MQISQRKILTIQDRSLPYSIGAPPGFWNTNMNDLQDLFASALKAIEERQLKESEGLARLFAVDLEGYD
jgi:hypothetical protein